MTIKPQTKSITVPDSSHWHRIVYDDWGPPDGRLVLCVHYLTGNAHYFAPLAEALAAAGYRVIAPDMPGRGRSDWLKNPDDYTIRQYIVDLACLLAALNVTAPQSIDWIGASMGGFLGMIIAAMDNSPVRRLGLIDVGPEVAPAVLEGIGGYIAPLQTFPTLEAAEEAIRAGRSAAWGPVPDGYWRAFTQANTRPVAGDSYTLHYDPALAVPFTKEATNGINLWKVWDAVPCPVLTLRGEQSMLLTAATAAQMAQRGPGAQGNFQLETIPNTGHVPSLATAEQIGLISNFLK